MQADLEAGEHAELGVCLRFSLGALLLVVREGLPVEITASGSASNPVGMRFRVGYGGPALIEREPRAFEDYIARLALASGPTRVEVTVRSDESALHELVELGKIHPRLVEEPAAA